MLLTCHESLDGREAALFLRQILGSARSRKRLSHRNSIDSSLDKLELLLLGFAAVVEVVELVQQSPPSRDGTCDRLRQIPKI
jgi:hypothetical protein